ncbi:MAG: deoxyribodipyrimidine photo-lyase [Crocinitomicaceae bacterium]|nr:deoxyribodipyrimidine photo-lyase [Crocinitomicaceae bacterium]
MKVSVFWFRRDLRLEDNVGLHHALKSGMPIVPIFIFDENILDDLPVDDPRVNFIYDELKEIHIRLQRFDSGLHIFYGQPIDIWEQIVDQFEIAQVFCNRDYEPYAHKRDAEVEEFLQSKGIQLKQYKDQVIFEEFDVVKDDGTPYTVYTPYMKKWKTTYAENPPKKLSANNYNHLYPGVKPFPTKQALNIKDSGIKVLPADFSRLKNYQKNRDIPEFDTTGLGPHLRFGTVSIRKIFEMLGDKHETFQNELIWREFFMQILFHYPKSVKQNFKRKYDQVDWRNNTSEFEKWCQGKTGYPMVDAGMRQLNETGYMHGRARMITASFLVKHLLVDWRWGEAYFAKKLLDFELASNVGNWQWVAGTGCDAAPYFRIFNPIEQQKKFDPKKLYINKWIPELEKKSYPKPMVEHKIARERCLKAYRIN